MCFVATLGLYTVIDAFTNAGDLLNTRESTWGRLREIATFYFFRGFWFLDAFGGTAAVLAALVTMALLLRYGELTPILAAGIPTYRLARPLVVATLVVNVALMLNVELIIPRLQDNLHMDTGADASHGTLVHPAYDHATQIHMAGEQLIVGQRKLVRAEFTLPAGVIVERLTVVKAGEAIYQSAAGSTPGGWLLRGAQPRFADLSLVSHGRTCILRGGQEDELFVTSDLMPDQLYDRKRTLEFHSSAELVRRLKNPALDPASSTAQSLHLHLRHMRYVINVLIVVVCVPIVIRKEARSILMNLAACAAVMGTTFAAIQGCALLARSHWMAPDLAAWLPVIVLGTWGAWTSAWIRT